MTRNQNSEGRPPKSPRRAAGGRRAGASRLETARARMYHDLIFECAERVFAEHGYDESTMQDVAAEAGVSLKTLYATFPGKSDIYAEIQSVRGLAFLDAVENGVGDGDALARLEGGARAFVHFLIEHEPFRRILLREGRAWGLDPKTEPTRASWRAGTDLVAATLRKGMDEGVFHPEDPVLLAASVQAVLQVQLAGRIELAGDDPDPEQIAEDILTLLRRMLCAPDTIGRQQ